MAGGSFKMKTRNLSTIALAGAMALGCNGEGKVKDSGELDYLSLKGTVERLRVDVHNEKYTAQIAIPGLTKFGEYDNILVTGAYDTLRIGVIFPFFSYGNWVNPPQPVGVGDVIEFDLTNGVSKNSDGTYQIPKFTDFPHTSFNGRINFYEKGNKK